MEADTETYSAEELRILYKVLRLLLPFDEYVNVTSLGGTPYEAIKKEFGL